MRYSIEGGALPIVRIFLESGETIVSESGGRTWFKGNVETKTNSGGGLKKMFGRALTGESLFMTNYTAQGAAEIVFTSSFPGKIMPVEIAPGKNVIAQKNAFMCATQGVELSMYMQKKFGAGLLGGEGFLMQKLSGSGMVFLEIDGYCVEYDLAAGERIVADTGVLAAMDESVSMDIERVKGVKNMMFGGEGLFDTVLTGPGKVYLQSMTIAKLAGLLQPLIVSGK